MQRDVGADFDDVPLAGDGVRGERGLAEKAAANGALCVAEGRRAVAGTHAGVVQFHEPVAVCRHVGRARRAGAAAGETHAHAVARRDLGHALADLDDDAGSLVPEHAR